MQDFDTNRDNSRRIFNLEEETRRCSCLDVRTSLWHRYFEPFDTEGTKLPGLRNLEGRKHILDPWPSRFACEP